MYKIKIVGLLLILLGSMATCGGVEAAYIYYEKYGERKYIVRGSVFPSDLEWNFGTAWSEFQVTVHETGTDHVQYLGSGGCSDDSVSAAQQINQRLAKGILVNIPATYANKSPPWTTSLICHTNYPNPGGWKVSSLSSPPTQPVCSVRLPSVVDFGTINFGGAAPSRREMLQVECDKNATGEAYFTMLQQGRVPVGDGWMTPRFTKSNGTRTRFTTYMNKYEEPVEFNLTDLGQDVGEKVGMAVIVMTWS